MKWLRSICLIKEGVKSLERKLHKICKNGVIFADIINRIEGRNQNIIKGIHRKPKKKSYINANYQTVFKYLRLQEKLNPRYIYAERFLKEGNHNVFWGFLDDLWHFYHNKISKHDKRYKKTKTNTSHISNSFRHQSARGPHTKASNISNTQQEYNSILYKSNQTFQNIAKKSQ